jgi:hypothetical protein
VLSSSEIRDHLCAQGGPYADRPAHSQNPASFALETPGSSHPVSRNASKTEPAKLLAIFVVDTEDKNLTTPVKE